jgi:hypothetical protein
MSFPGDNIKGCLLTDRVCQILILTTLISEIKYISANRLFSTSITLTYRWRALGYEKAIMAIKRHPKAITTHDEASKIPGVGSKMADKVTTVM